MYRSNRWISLLCLLVLCQSCSLWESNPATVQEYLAWLGSTENGLSHEVTVNGVVIRATYLPAEYLAYQEMRNNGTTDVAYRDSLLAMYRHSRAFMIEFAPDTTKGRGDVLFKDVYSHGEYSHRVRVMNFSLHDYLTLETGGARHAPSLALFENTYSLANNRKAMVLFTPKQGGAPLSDDDMTVVFYDEIYHTGIHRFAFSRERLAGLPGFPFGEAGG